MRARSRSKPDRPYPIRLRSLTRVIWPSTLPVLHSCSTPAMTAPKSAANVLTNLLKEGNALAEACSIHRDRFSALRSPRIARNCNLHGIRGDMRHSLRIGGRAVTGHNLNARVPAEPFGDWIRCAPRDDAYRPPGLKVIQQRTVGSTRRIAKSSMPMNRGALSVL